MVIGTTLTAGPPEGEPRRSKRSLAAQQRKLVELMQSIRFGRIDGLIVRGGLPVLDPPPRVVRDIKFGGLNGAAPQRRLDDFVLKEQVVELFAYLAQMGEGVVEELQIKDGLPLLMRVADAA